MMKTLALGVSLLALATSTASAGGIDRSGQWITPIFDKGDVVTFSVATVDPNVSGTLVTNDVTTRYSPVSFSIKKALTENVDVAIIADQPFGANIKYNSGPLGPNTSTGFTGGFADVTSKALTFVGRYKFDGNWSLHGGARMQSLSGNIVSGNGLLNASGDYAWGYLIGGAYERPDIAMRVALTYNSSINNTLDGTSNFAPATVTHKSPESLNLEFQTGIAADTLLFGSVRYVKWDGRTLDSNPGGLTSTNWVNFEDDTTSFTLGVGRKINDKLSLAVTLGYEAAGARPTNTALAPTAGYKSIGLGASYNINESLKVTGGVQYIKPGDQSFLLSPSPSGPAIEYSGDAVAFGMKISYSF